MNVDVLSRCTSRGAGLIEVVVATALLTIIFTGLFGVLTLGTRLATDNKSRTGALSLALERIEYIRSLDYNDIGTVGGDPQGSLVVSENVELNGVQYIRRTSIVYIDDAKDGVGVSDVNGIINDYKRVKVAVSWEGQTGTRVSSLVSDVAPIGIES